MSAALLTVVLKILDWSFMPICIIGKSDVCNEVYLVPNDALVCVDILQDHWFSDDFDSDTEFFIKLSHKRVAPCFAKFQPPSEWSDARHGSVIEMDLTRQQ